MYAIRSYYDWSGHGLIDLAAYDKYLTGQLADFEFPGEDIEEAEKVLEGWSSRT